MVRRFLNSILGLFRKKREYSLIIEEIGNCFELTYAKTDFKKKKVIFLKRKKVKEFKKIRRPFVLLDKLILALNSAHATTIESVVYLHRQRPHDDISEAELDHLIFKGLWEFLNHYRNWAAKKMGVSDLDLVLANIEIRDVGLGTHRVFNPIGFKGADFFLRLRGTFMPRDILAVMSSLSGWAKYAAIVEDVGIVSTTIPEATDFVVHAGHEKTVVFSLSEEEKLYAREIPWGFVNIINDITQILAVDDEMAKLILDRHLQNKVSKRFERVIQAVIAKQFKALLANLSSVYNKTKRAKARPTVHFNFRFLIKLPDAFFDSSRVRTVNFAKWLELQGFSINFRGHKFNRPDQNTLALLMHPYRYPHYDFLNQLLRRRAKWLVVNP